MNENRDSIMRMARGAFEERVDYEMDKVIQNILDPNTKATAKRKITLTIELTPDDERRQIQVSVTAKSTLAATNPVATSLYVTGDSNGELVVAEMVPQVPGQLNMDGTQQEAPKLLKLVTRAGVCKLIRTELEKVGTTIMVQAKSYKSVEVMTTYLPDFSRNILYRAEADAPGIDTGFRSREVALIELRSLFIPNEGTAYLLDLLGRMTDEKSVSTNDNGVTQTVEARQGVALNALVEVKPRVLLRPFRTFLEVEQPESEFLLRVHPEEGIGFFEADGGIWKLEAKKNIADYFNTNLADLIEAGKVVIMQ